MHPFSLVFFHYLFVRGGGFFLRLDNRFTSYFHLLYYTQCRPVLVTSTTCLYNTSCRPVAVAAGYVSTTPRASITLPPKPPLFLHSGKITCEIQKIIIFYEIFLALFSVFITHHMHQDAM
jgi:hypothetical protein